MAFELIVSEALLPILRATGILSPGSSVAEAPHVGDPGNVVL